MRNYELKYKGKDYSVKMISLTSSEAIMEVDGVEHTITIGAVNEVLSTAVPDFSGYETETAPKPKPGAASAVEGAVTAPIPGSIMEVYVKVGDSVKTGDPLFKMEAMKMENEISARVDGTVSSVSISAGDTVNQGDELIVIAP